MVQTASLYSAMLGRTTGLTSAMLRWMNGVRNGLPLVAPLFGGTLVWIGGSIIATPEAHATAEQVFAAVAPSVVVVTTQNSEGVSVAFGSGVVIAPNAVVTNCHVLQGGNRHMVRSDAREVEAKISYVDISRDICQLKADVAAKAVRLGTTSKLHIGQKVYAIGNPQGLTRSISDGIISSLRDFEDNELIQITAPISPGSSGGGLFDENGTLIGITSFLIVGGQNLTFALPVEWIRELGSRAKAVTTNDAISAAPIRTQLDFDVGYRKAICEHNSALGIELALAETAAKPNYVWAWANLIRFYMRHHEQGKAEEALRHIERLKPGGVAALYGRALILSFATEKRETRRAAQQLVAVPPDPGDAREWIAIGVGYLWLEQYESAKTSYERAVAINPSSLLGAIVKSGVRELIRRRSCRSDVSRKEVGGPDRVVTSADVHQSSLVEIAAGQEEFDPGNLVVLLRVPA